MTTKQAWDIYNVLYNINKNGISDEKVKRTMIENLIALHFTAEEYKKQLDLLTAQYQLTGSETNIIKAQNVKNFTISKKKLDNSNVDIELQKITIENLDKASSATDNFNLGAYVVLLPMLSLPTK